MITCTFNGRLGNNLFQIATTLSIAHEIGCGAIFPETTWAGHRGHRDVDLSMFSYNFNRGVIETSNSFNESQFHYNKIPILDDLTIHGFYQSSKYFDSIRHELLNTYFSPAEHIINQLKKYKVSNRSLGISIRRGDYLMLQDNHCVLSIDYYQNAINKYFLDNTDEIYIFSDDIDWCRSVFGDDVHYVTDSIGTQLFLMSKMQNLILSNSTFAWWGAYLNQNNGIIVAPDPWFGPNNHNKDTSGLYCKNWIRYNHTISVENYTLTQNMFD